MILKRIISMLLLCVCSLGTTAHAQEEIVQLTGSGAMTGSGTLTGSGAMTGSGTIQDIQAAKEKAEAEEAWQARIERSKAFRKSILQTSDSLEKLREGKQSNIRKRAEHRHKCYEDFRRASKYTRLSVAIRCYRAELTINLEYLRKERIYIGKMPGVTEDAKALANTKIDILLDAITSIVTAIDSNVFGSVKELEETKINLLTMYRRPKWMMITRLKAENIMTWTASLSTRIAGIINKYKDTDPEISEELINGITCLSESDIILQSVIDEKDSKGALQKLHEAQENIRRCFITLQKTHLMYQTIYEPENLPKEQDDPYMSRRLRRRLQ